MNENKYRLYICFHNEMNKMETNIFYYTNNPYYKMVYTINPTPNFFSAMISLLPNVTTHSQLFIYYDNPYYNDVYEYGETPTEINLYCLTGAKYK